MQILWLFQLNWLEKASKEEFEILLKSKNGKAKLNEEGKFRVKFLQTSQKCLINIWKKFGRKKIGFRLEKKQQIRNIEWLEPTVDIPFFRR